MGRVDLILFPPQLLCTNHSSSYHPHCKELMPNVNTFQFETTPCHWWKKGFRAPFNTDPPGHHFTGFYLNTHPSPYPSNSTLKIHTSPSFSVLRAFYKNAALPKVIQRISTANPTVFKHRNGNTKVIPGSQLVAGQGQNSSSPHFNCQAMKIKSEKLSICNLWSTSSTMLNIFQEFPRFLIYFCELLHIKKKIIA